MRMMPITIFGMFLIILLIYGFIRNKTLESFFDYFYTIALIITTNVHMGYFLKIGGVVLTYDAFFMYILLLLSVLLFGGKYSKKGFCFLLVSLVVLALNYLSFSLFPYRDAVIVNDWEGYVLGKNVYSVLTKENLKIGYYLCFAANIVIIERISHKYLAVNYVEILRNIVKYSKISIVVGYLELLTKNLLHSKIVTDLCIFVFGSEGVQQNALTLRNGLITLQGATKEASMYTTLIFYIIILMLLQDRFEAGPKRINLRWELASTVLLLLNPAMSSYVYITIIALILLTSSFYIGKQKMSWQKIKKTIIILMILTFSFCVVRTLSFNYMGLLNSSNYILQRIGRFFEQMDIIISGVGGLVNSSEAQRFSGIVYDFRLWLKRPFLGFGSGTISCVSGIITMLVDFGLIAVIIYFYAICKYASKKRKLLFFIILFSIEVWVLPSIMLNDLKTVFMLVIPFICLAYGELLNINYSKRLSLWSINNEDKSDGYSCNNDI